MLIRRRRGWETPEAHATPEALVVGRRAALGAGAALFAAPALAQQGPPIAPAPDPAFTAMRNPRFRPERDITAMREAATYNNYYEFGSHKGIWPAAQRLPQRPWTIRIEGLVEREREIGIEEILRIPAEERVLRLRCVEAWAMTVPWTGFAMSELLRLASPLSSARYVVFETAMHRPSMTGLRQSWYPWPYTEGCTIAEAANELAFVATGMYGRPLPPQNGGPVRILFPWKYGFKSGKSIVAVRFAAERPVSFWERLQGNEYGFWANVNPEVPHPRWSQATERLLGTNERVPTRLFNGYGEFVAGLYTGLQHERLWA
ncbi:MAG: protein-methionine-sulfoxide reductase catalytic subunit MsrP [Acetobacteraceae bacterium]|nr:protein-methionine-sulfoxide reductase catalytic subunit MsrP [Acetobacteraceae bacterium]MDW8397374.1 protein-methionine-sulfoxide reductase catalytic subunit MsrP [Acetobacteraceae bacterium]